MSLGTELALDAHYRSFTLHNNAAIPAVFGTGGIGVTPVRSSVLQAIPCGLLFVASLNDVEGRSCRFSEPGNPPSFKSRGSLRIAIHDIA